MRSSVGAGPEPSRGTTSFQRHSPTTKDGAAVERDLMLASQVLIYCEGRGVLSTDEKREVGGIGEIRDFMV